MIQRILGRVIVPSSDSLLAQIDSAMRRFDGDREQFLLNIVCNPGVTEIQLPDLTIHLSEGEFITTEDIVNIESEKGA